MESLDKIHAHVERSTMILVVSNNTKSLLDTLFNSLYKKCSLQKVKFETRKGLMRKLPKIKNKIIKIEYDLEKIQFSSSTNTTREHTTFLTLKAYLKENNSKLLIKTDVSKIKDFSKALSYSIPPKYQLFDLVIYLDKKEIKLIRYADRTYKKGENIFDINRLLRNTKLKQIQKKIQKGSL